MKYKNVVFDFGNVIGKFDGNYILEQFCESKEDRDILYPVIFKNWAELDRGTIDYEANALEAEAGVPDRLKPTVRRFFRDWTSHVPPVEETYSLIRELEEQGYSLYLLSSAATYFAEWAAALDILKGFDGIVFSAPIRMAKPDAEIYQYLFQKYHLKPEECLFVDDLEQNIRAAEALGMDGIRFTGDTDAVRRMLAF